MQSTSNTWSSNNTPPIELTHWAVFDLGAERMIVGKSGAEVVMAVPVISYNLKHRIIEAGQESFKFVGDEGLDAEGRERFELILALEGVGKIKDVTNEYV